MAKKKKIELEDELDGDLNFEGEEKEDYCAKKMLLPWVWVLGVLVVVVVLFAVFRGNAPSPKRISHAWGEPEKTLKLFTRQAAQTGQVAAWTYQGRAYSCPNCGWRGTRLGIDSIGNQVCPNCFHCPSQRNVATGRGVAAVTSASPMVRLVRELGMEVVDTQRGVLVAQVYGGSWAQKGGLKHGDIILKFDHKKVGSTAQFRKVIQAATPERRHSVKVSRIGKIKRLNVMVGEGEMEGVILPVEAQAGAAVAWAPGQGRLGANCPYLGQSGAAAAWAPQGRGRMGGYGLGPVGYVVCPNCGFKMLHQRGIPAYSMRCPKCGSTMVREEILNQAAGQAQIFCPAR